MPAPRTDSPPDDVPDAPAALDPEACYRAWQARDARFDGRVFVGVTSTGIYCRPVCPARTPKAAHCRFYPSAAAAHAAGFRPCLRCRPETAPDLGAWRGTWNTVSRGLALIADGALDRPRAGGDGSDRADRVEALAARLGVGGRHLRRLFVRHLGATPVAVAQTRRVLFAARLLRDTPLSATDVALAAGFGSVRRFNEVFLALYGRPPSALRRAGRGARGPAAPLAEAASTAPAVTLDLRYRPPYDWDAMLDHLAARAVPGVEWVQGGAYGRTVVEGAHAGTITVTHAPERASVRVAIAFPDLRALPAVVARVRRAFDLGADVGAIGAHLALDPLLAPLVAQRPGLRVAGAWDGFELAVRAVLGQQVSVAAARRFAGRLVAHCGGAVAPRVGAVGGAPAGADARHDGSPADGPLVFAFPTPAQLAAADLGALGVPAARRATLHALAGAALADPGLLAPGRDAAEAVARLRAIPGVGAWTAEYVALRALREPDAFPASDVALRRGLARRAGANGRRPTSAALAARAEPWRPWRAYAAQHLWADDARGGP